MKGKLIIALFCVFLMATATIPAYGVTQKANVTQSLEIAENVIEISDENREFSENFIMTHATLSNQYTAVKSIEGPQETVEKMERCLNNRPPLLARLLPAYLMYIEGINITLTYSKDVSNNSRYAYATVNTTVEFDDDGFPIIDEENLTTTRNTKHEITINNCTGIFLYHRARLVNGLIPNPNPRRLFVPASFTLFGYAEDFELLPLTE
jgi:hypothetical protein